VDGFTDGESGGLKPGDQLLGYGRFDRLELVELVNDLYENACPSTWPEHKSATGPGISRAETWVAGPCLSVH